MECKYIGNFDEPHGVYKKRCMVGQTKDKALSLIQNKGISSETYREMEAVRLMRQG